MKPDQVGAAGCIFDAYFEPSNSNYVGDENAANWSELCNELAI